MDDFLTLACWRSAGRQTDLGAALGAALDTVAPQLPVRRALIRLHVATHAGWETLAQSGAAWTTASGAAAATVPELNAGEVLIDEAAQAAGRAILPDPADGMPVLAVLMRTPQLTAVLALDVPSGSPPAVRQAAARALAEPLTAALQHHLREREIAAQREAAEADRRSLLSRLGRSDLGDTIVGAERGLRPVMDRVAQVAPSDVPVLLLGETGSGKELVARAVHRRSRRAQGPFLRVNCGAIPPELIDSELFGHERGSFTGAVAQRRGWFERADGGTLFMDEVAELPLAAQVRLLRVLQDGLVTRVGSEHALPVDVRVIAATHQDLAAMIRDGRFRQDLWYRLAVFPIELPPLRDRLEDVPALALHFAQRAAARLGLAPCTPSDEDLRLLCGYPWPGNIRELSSVIERAAILGNGRSLKVAQALGLPSAGTRPQPVLREEAGPVLAPAPAAAATPAPWPTLQEQERLHVEQALARTLGRVDGPFGAARLLGLNPQTLRSRMKKLGVQARRFRAAAQD